MKTETVVLALLLTACSAPAPEAAAANPLVGSWRLERYADTPRGEPPVQAFGQAPIGLFVFTADGRISISIMRNPPEPDKASVDPDPEACIPTWYCSYFGTYTFDPKKPSWTTHVEGGNIPAYLGTDQTRLFQIEGDRLVIREQYTAGGKTYDGERILRRLTDKPRK